MQVAVIDLGTNTFNMLIAEQNGQSFKIIYNEKISVKLGRGGIVNNIIKPEAFDRGLTALTAHKQVIENHNVQQVIALGTSALRTAENSCDFVNIVKDKLGIDIQIISGQREAELIYKGVFQTLENKSGNILILDIGGGSNEFILVRNNEIVWKESFKLGMARLIELFRPSDPVQPEEILAMEKYFDKELQPLFQALKSVKIDYFVGAEGTFESFYNMIHYFLNSDYHPQKSDTAKLLNQTDTQTLHEILIRSTSGQRMKMKGLEPYRVEMIVTATIFVDYILKHLKIGQILVSPYSMKEGAAWEVFNN